MNAKDVKKDLERRIKNCAAINDLSERPEFKLLMEAFGQMAEREKEKLMNTPANDTIEIQKRQFTYKFLTEIFPNFIKSTRSEGYELVARAIRDGLLSVTDAQSPVDGTRPVSVV